MTKIKIAKTKAEQPHKKEVIKLFITDFIIDFNLIYFLYYIISLDTLTDFQHTCFYTQQQRFLFP